MLQPQMMTHLDKALTAKGLVNPVTVVAQSEFRLGRLTPQACAAFAVFCAQRLLDAHLCLPRSEQRPFTLSLAPVLREIWSGLERADSSLERQPSRTTAEISTWIFLNSLV